MSQKRAVILGAAGFIGSHLVDRFLAEGWRVTGVDNLITGTRRNLEHLSREPRFDFIEEDICGPLDLGGPIDAVLDFASPASPIDYLEHPFATLHVGSIGVENALKVAKRAGATFLLSSTSEVYGDPLEHPQRETYWGNVDPIGPRSQYDEGKRFAEALTVAYVRQYGLDGRIVRIFNSYGPRMQIDDGRMPAAFIVAAVTGKPIPVQGDGTQTRSLCFVGDTSEGLIAAMERGRSGEVYNIGRPDEMSVLEFAQRVRRVAHSSSEITFVPGRTQDIHQRRPDCSKAAKELRWRARTTLSEGLRKTIDWYRGEQRS